MTKKKDKLIFDEDTFPEALKNPSFQDRTQILGLIADLDCSPYDYRLHLDFLDHMYDWLMTEEGLKEKDFVLFEEKVIEFNKHFDGVGCYCENKLKKLNARKNRVLKPKYIGRGRSEKDEILKALLKQKAQKLREDNPNKISNWILEQLQLMTEFEDRTESWIRRYALSVVSKKRSQ